MSEANLWKYLRDNMTAWEAQRIEDKYSTGIPDVAYSMGGVHGWIELKFLPNYPKGDILKVDHFTIDQRNWIERHGKAGSRCFVLLQVEKEYFIFDHTTAHNVGKLCVEGHRRLALCVWNGRINWRELCAILTKSK